MKLHFVLSIAIGLLAVGSNGDNDGGVCKCGDSTLFLDHTTMETPAIVMAPIDYRSGRCSSQPSSAIVECQLHVYTDAVNVIEATVDAVSLIDGDLLAIRIIADNGQTLTFDEKPSKKQIYRSTGNHMIVALKIAPHSVPVLSLPNNIGYNISMKTLVKGAAEHVSELKPTDDEQWNELFAIDEMIKALGLSENWVVPVSIAASIELTAYLFSVVVFIHMRREHIKAKRAGIPIYTTVDWASNSAFAITLLGFLFMGGTPFVILGLALHQESKQKQLNRKQKKSAGGNDDGSDEETLLMDTDDDEESEVELEVADAKTASKRCRLIPVHRLNDASPYQQQQLHHPIGQINMIQMNPNRGHAPPQIVHQTTQSHACANPYAVPSAPMAAAPVDANSGCYPQLPPMEQKVQAGVIQMPPQQYHGNHPSPVNPAYQNLEQAPMTGAQGTPMFYQVEWKQ